MLTYVHLIRDTKNGFTHALAIKNEITNEIINQGSWVGYNSPASMKYLDSVYIVTTDYFKDSVEFPIPGELYQITSHQITSRAKTKEIYDSV